MQLDGRPDSNLFTTGFRFTETKQFVTNKYKFIKINGTLRRPVVKTFYTDRTVHVFFFIFCVFLPLNLLATYHREKHIITIENAEFFFNYLLLSSLQCSIVVHDL